MYKYCHFQQREEVHKNLKPRPPDLWLVHPPVSVHIHIVRFTFVTCIYLRNCNCFVLFDAQHKHFRSTHTISRTVHTYSIAFIFRWTLDANERFSSISAFHLFTLLSLSLLKILCRLITSFSVKITSNLLWTCRYFWPTISGSQIFPISSICNLRK